MTEDRQMADVAAMRAALDTREDVGSEAWYFDMANAYEAEVAILRRDLAEARAALAKAEADLREMLPRLAKAEGWYHPDVRGGQPT